MVGASSVCVTTEILHKHQCSKGGEVKDELTEEKLNTEEDKQNSNQMIDVTSEEERHMSTGKLHIVYIQIEVYDQLQNLDAILGSVERFIFLTNICLV